MTSVVCFENVSKRFTLYHNRPRTLRELTLSLLGQGDSFAWREDLWALKEVSFEVEQGETLGIIGPNGAGKSTILKLITRILEPTSGWITVNGRVSALLELGAGFHPDLTGRENIYLNGSILGFSKKEMDRKFEDIVAFSEMKRFIDMPVKHYSSGMYMRLSFAIAINLEPDILLIDEVLAVGDQSFQRKCLDKIQEFKSRGTTIVFVSHNLDMVRNLCKKAIWLNEGIVESIGPADQVIEHYLSSFAVSQNVVSETKQGQEERTEIERGREVEITDVCFLDEEGNERSTFETGGRMTARIKYRAFTEVEDPVFGVAIYRDDGVRINGPNTRLSNCNLGRICGEGAVDYIVENLPLLAGVYRFTAAIFDRTGLIPYDYHDQRYTFAVQQRTVREVFGVCYIPCRWEHHREDEG